jgi:hypothetical protein
MGSGISEGEGHGRSWWRAAAIPVALGALYPWVLSRSLTQDSGSMSSGSGPAWEVTFHDTVNRPTLLLGLTAVTLWAVAALLWASRAGRVAAGAAGVGLAVAGACAVISAGWPQPRSSLTPALLTRVRLGESRAAVVARLGPAPYLGVGTRGSSDRTLPCLVYQSSSGPVPGPALCFRAGVLATEIRP